MAKREKNIKYLGIDWGEKRIGLALGESESKTAVPFKTVSEVKEILSAVEEEEIEEIVIGQPFKKNKEAKLDEKYTAFIGKLSDKNQLPIHFIDERLTSRAADALPGGKKDKAGRDEIAAMLILQSYLDQL